MKILAISKVQDKKQVESAIDLWRVYRPMKELAKHVDWQIDYQSHVIRKFDKLPQKYRDDPGEFIKHLGEREVDHLGQYDIIFTSYFTSPHVYTLLWGAHKKHGTKFVFDIDDDLYDIDWWNPFHIFAGKAGVVFLQRMATITKYISTTNEHLATKLRNKSEAGAQVFVNPNWISDDYQHGPIDNGDKIVIGYFGGASHYRDIHNTNFVPALRRIMHDHKNVYFKMAGQPLDQYLPRKRVEIIDPVQGKNWPLKLFPKLSYDIALAPLMDTPFSKSKSNIKWQEATRMGAAVIASSVGPYQKLPGGTVKLVNNTEEDWYNAILKLLDAETRKQQVEKAQTALKAFRMEDNWLSYKSMFEGVFNDTDNTASK